MRLHRPQALVLRGLHILVLSSFALAQPLFDLLSDTPEFFVARGFTSWDVVAAGLGLVFVPAAALLAVEALAGFIHPHAQTAVHLIIVGGLLSLIALQALGDLDDSHGRGLVVVAALLGALVGAAYARFAPVRTLVTVLAPAPFVFLFLFLMNSPIQELRLQGSAEAGSRPAVDSRTPVVLIVFDEFPLASLLDAEGQVDAQRFPAFGRLAQDATWFRNATTVHEHTTAAVPSILTGEDPSAGALPLLADHPRNVFTFLARSYRPHVLEPVTQLCPSDVCEISRPPFAERMKSLASDLRVVYLHLTLPDDLAEDLPPIDENWQGFGVKDDAVSGGEPLADENVAGQLWRDQGFAFERWVSEIGPDRGVRPPFHFIHTLLPHRPWRYLPSGRRYASAGVRGIDEGVKQPDDWLLTQDYQAHLLQVGFSDRLLGMALDRLRVSGLYDRSLIIATADHGASFRQGYSRRGVSPATISDIAAVPLFVKRPAQASGETVERTVRTTDILPTIADVLGTPLPAPVDGRSLFDPAAPDRSTVIVERTSGDRISASPSQVADGVTAAVARKVALFGDGGWESVFEIGPHRELIGRSLREVTLVASSTVSASLDNEMLFEDVDPGSALAPSRLSGQLSGSDSETPLDLALAVNDRIAAVTRTTRAGGEMRFTALAPASAFRAGRNSVEVFAVRTSEGGLLLERLRGGGPAASLETEGGSTVIRLGVDRELIVVPNALRGAVERWSYEPATAVIAGWAADVDDRELVDRVLFFLDRRLVYSTQTPYARPDVVQQTRGLRPVGFIAEFPLEVVGHGEGQIRVFAIRGENATELSYPDGFPWR